MLPLSSYASVCEKPNTIESEKITIFTAQLYRVNGNDLKLSAISQVSQRCYSKFTFEAVAPNREITVFFSPQEKLVFPAIYDLSEDPLNKEKLIREKIQSQLLSGRPPTWGDDKAPVKVIAFSDFQCKYCGEFARAVQESLNSDDLKLFQLVFRNFPLPMHDWAWKAAVYGACLANQNSESFWRYYEYIYVRQGAINSANFGDTVRDFISNEPKIDEKSISLCVDNGQGDAAVKTDVALGRDLGVNSTPLLFINGRRIKGFKDSEDFMRLVKMAVSEK
ncbi:MAG TPA: thioredoxin domain-containing protein [Edaphobacter sp.]|nr:thioredoxin domain-containing protein [Edaphobacter sp.]